MKGLKMPMALIAEDCSLVRMDLENILQDAGYDVYQVGTGEEALETLCHRGNDVQVLITDVQMPPGKLSGFDLAKICAHRWTHISIVVASGTKSPEAQSLPDNIAFLSKPFSAHQVYETLGNLGPVRP